MRQPTWIFATLIVLVSSGSRAQETERYDTVLLGGRVISPATDLDAIRNVGISGTQIAAVTTEPIQGDNEIDVSGLVVSPGFIDLHAHGQDAFSARLQAQDGVTTALELEMGVHSIQAWIAGKEGKSPINFGSAAGYISARIAAMHGQEALDKMVASGSRAFIGTDWSHRQATPEEQAKIASFLEAELAQGALGIGTIIQYTPGASREEILNMFHLAAKHEVICFIHPRYISEVEPASSLAAIQELIADAAVSGAALHVVHLNSSALGKAGAAANMIEGARQNGVDVSTEAYPYTAASTTLESEFFSEGWQERLGISYEDLEWIETGERLDAESFATYSETGGWVAIHMMQPEWVQDVIKAPGVIIASDGVAYINGRAHPRGAGTYSRILGRVVREDGALTLMEALEKMTIAPARRMEVSVPAMARKGRIEPGADADITVFNADTVIDRATFAEPALPAKGIIHVLVHGTLVVHNGVLDESANPGQPVIRP